MRGGGDASSRIKTASYLIGRRYQRNGFARLADFCLRHDKKRLVNDNAGQAKLRTGV